MAGTNDFLAFATGVGANVMTQADYDVAPFVGTGFAAGLAQSAQLNKVWRQSAFMAAVIGQLIAEQTGQNVQDNGDLEAMVALLAAAIQQASTITPARVITSSAPFTLALTDYKVGFNRTAGVAAQAVAIPNGMSVGQDMILQDLVGNFNADPVTLTPPAGSINGLPTYVLNEDKGRNVLTYWGSNIYTVGMQ